MANKRFSENSEFNATQIYDDDIIPFSHDPNNQNVDKKIQISQLKEFINKEQNQNITNLQNNKFDKSGGTITGNTTIGANNSRKNLTVVGDLSVTGSISQQGESYITHAEQVRTKNNLIITRENATTGLANNELTGIQATKYDGTNDGQLVFDKDGIARVGDVGDTQPLATRAEDTNMVSGNFTKWDGTNKKLVTSNVNETTISTMANKIPAAASTSNQLADKNFINNTYVPKTTTINDKQLSSNINLTADDVGALSLENGGRINGKVDIYNHLDVKGNISVENNLYGSGSEFNIEALEGKTLTLQSLDDDNNGKIKLISPQVDITGLLHLGGTDIKNFPKGIKIGDGDNCTILETEDDVLTIDTSTLYIDAETYVTNDLNAGEDLYVNKTVYANEFVCRNKSNKTFSSVCEDITNLQNKIGSTNGIASLGSDGKVPSSQLPSYVDDVLEYASQSNFPSPGEASKIYVAKDTNKIYRWGGSSYIVISETLALGETSSTAYRGDRGKIAYDHSQSTHAPTNAERNVITTVKGNGTALTVDSNRAVNITASSVGAISTTDGVTKSMFSYNATTKTLTITM